MSEASLNVLSMTGREAQICTENPKQCIDELKQIPEILEMAMEHHHTIENPDVVQILQAEAETYEQIRQEMKL